MDNSRIIRTLLITVVAEVISFGVLIPIAPVLFTDPTSPYYMLPPGFSVQQGFLLLGLLIGLYPLGQFIATPILGEMSDVYGRKKVIELSVLGTVISSLIFAYGVVAGSIPVLFLSRIINGLTGGLISVTRATIADITEKSERSKNFGLIGAAFGLGFVLGPFLGGILSSDLFPFLSADFPFWVASGISAISLVFVHYRLRETSPMEKESVNWRKPLDQLRKGLNLPGLQKLFATNFFYFSGFAFFTTFIPVFLVRIFDFTQLQQGVFFFYIGLLLIFGRTVFLEKVFSYVDEEKALPVALFLTGFFIFLQPLSPNLPVFIVFVTLFSLNNGLAMVAINTLISNKSSEKDQGLALGTSESLRALGNAIPSMMSGVAAALVATTTPLFVSGLLIMLTGVGYRYFKS